MVRVDWELIPISDQNLGNVNVNNLSGNYIDVRRFRISSGDRDILYVNEAGEVILNAKRIQIDFTDVATKTDLQEIELTPGPQGADGVGITSTVITYARSTSGTSAPTSGWTSEVPSVPAGEFLWTKTIWNYSDSTSETGYSVARIGADGAGIASVTNYYLASTQSEGITRPSGSGGRNLIRALNSNNYSGILAVNEEGVVIRGGNGAYDTLKALYKAKTSSGNHVFSYSMKEGSSHRVLIKIYDENEKEIENKSIPGWTWNIYYKGYFTQVSNNGYAVFNAPSETRYITGVIVPPWDEPIVNYTLLWMKLEKGTVATDWTSAPEDSGWTTIPQQLSYTKRFLWNYRIELYTDDTTKTTEPAVIGVYGDKGTDGRTPYVHWAYSDKADGTGLTTSDNGQRYIGHYSDYTQDDSMDKTKYTWADRWAKIDVGGGIY